MLAHRNLHIYTIWIFLCLFVSSFSFLIFISPSSLLFLSPAGDSLWNINYDALSRLCAWPTEKPRGVYMCAFLWATVLPANDHCFSDLLPFFSLLLSVAFFSAPFHLWSRASSFCYFFPLLRCPTAHANSNTSLEHRLPFVSANQIFPKLSCLSCLSLFSLCVRDYVVMRVSCL